MHPTERRAYLYVAAEMEGYEVDWETGEIRQRQPQQSSKPALRSDAS